jgi:hypothetical protein
MVQLLTQLFSCRAHVIARMEGLSLPPFQPLTEENITQSDNAAITTMAADVNSILAYARSI